MSSGAGSLRSPKAYAQTFTPLALITRSLKSLPFFLVTPETKSKSMACHFILRFARYE
jgi:hypothetical protein